MNRLLPYLQHKQKIRTIAKPWLANHCCSVTSSLLYFFPLCVIAASLDLFQNYKSF